MTMTLPDAAVVHRAGGGTVGNLRLKPDEVGLSPQGVSVFVGGPPLDVLRGLRAVYKTSRKWRRTRTVGSATVGDIRAAGFEVVSVATPNFANHARLTHPAGAAGFTDENLARLTAVFQATEED